MDRGSLFLITGPSGVGKTTLVTDVCHELGSSYKRIVTYTTRPVRDNEHNGIDYYFIDTGTFQAYQQRGFFVESGMVYGYWYGVPRSLREELEKGLTLFLIIDREGVQRLRTILPSVVSVWIAPPPLLELQKRLQQRKDVLQKDTQHRMARIKEEIALFKEDTYDYIVPYAPYEVMKTCMKQYVLQEREKRSFS
jgi:guanylate kinase